MFTFILSTAAISSLVFGIYQYRHLFINSYDEIKDMTDSVKGAIMVGNGECQAECYQTFNDHPLYVKDVCHSVTSNGNCNLACPNEEDTIEVKHALWANGWKCDGKSKYKKCADPKESTNTMEKVCDGKKKECNFVIGEHGELDMNGDRVGNLGDHTRCAKQLLVWYKCGKSNKCPSEEAAELTSKEC